MQKKQIKKYRKKQATNYKQRKDNTEIECLEIYINNFYQSLQSNLRTFSQSDIEKNLVLINRSLSNLGKDYLQMNKLLEKLAACQKYLEQPIQLFVNAFQEFKSTFEKQIYAKRGDEYKKGLGPIKQLPSDVVNYMAFFFSNASLNRFRMASKFLRTSTNQELIRRLECSSIKIVTSAHSESSFFIKEGFVWACGNNINDQLGFRSSDEQFELKLVPNLTDVKTIVTGQYSTFFIKKDGTIWACGRNSSGELGFGDKEDRSIPELIFNLTDIKAIAASRGHTLFLKNDGTVLACGYNYYGSLGLGELGLNDTKGRPTPELIPNLTNIQQVAVGDHYSFFLKKDGTVWACGTNSCGQLGLGHNNNCSKPELIPNLTDVKAIVTGRNHTLFLKKDGTIWACGANSRGQLGLGDEQDRSRPELIPGLTDVQAVLAGKSCTFFIKRNGTVWGCGKNSSGQLGLSNQENRFKPELIPDLTDIQDIASGYNHTIFLKKDGTIWVCGSNSEGQLGIGKYCDPLNKITKITLFNKEKRIALLKKLQEEHNKDNKNTTRLSI